MEWKTFYSSKYESERKSMKRKRRAVLELSSKHQSEFLRRNQQICCLFICTAHLQICHQECEMNVDSCWILYFIQLKASIFICKLQRPELNASNSLRSREFISENRNYRAMLCMKSALFTQISIVYVILYSNINKLHIFSKEDFRMKGHYVYSRKSRSIITVNWKRCRLNAYTFPSWFAICLNRLCGNSFGMRNETIENCFRCTHWPTAHNRHRERLSYCTDICSVFKANEWT